MRRILYCLLPAALFVCGGALAASSHSLRDEIEYSPGLTPKEASDTCAVRFPVDQRERTLRFICLRRALYVCNEHKAIPTTLPDAMRDCIILRARRYD